MDKVKQQVFSVGCSRFKLCVQVVSKILCSIIEIRCTRSFSINAVILTQARSQGLRIIQSPVTHYPRIGGTQTGANPIVISTSNR